MATNRFQLQGYFRQEHEYGYLEQVRVVRHGPRLDFRLGLLVQVEVVLDPVPAEAHGVAEVLGADLAEVANAGRHRVPVDLLPHKLGTRYTS